MLPTHRLRKAFVPTSVAVIGASNRKTSLGTSIWSGVANSGRLMEAYPVNPKYKYIGVTPCWSSLAELPVVPDLAVLALPSKHILESLGECAAKGVPFALLPPGDEDCTADRLWREQVLETARNLGIRLIGPESIGIMRPDIGLNVSYWPTLAKAGRVGLICQSGSVTASVLDYAERHHIGFSSVITSGHESDITVSEMVDFLATDPATGIIALHIETLRHPRAFYSAIRAASRSKPVVILKAASANASRLISARSSLATGEDTIFDALVRRAGAVRCALLEEFLVTIEAFAAEKFPRLPGRIAMIANGLGFASLSADVADYCALELAQPRADSQQLLAKLIGSPLALTNPVDLGVTASTKQFCAALKILLDDPRTDGVLLSMSPSNGEDPHEAARMIAEASRSSFKPVITSWGGRDVAFESDTDPRTPLLPCAPSAHLAALAFSHLLEFVRNRELRMRPPKAGSDTSKIDLVAARAVAMTAQSEKRHRLLESQAEELLRAFGIPTGKSILVTNPGQAASTAESIGFPVAMKLAAAGVAQKTDVGGVMLNILSAAEAQEAFNTLRRNCSKYAPMAAFRGVIVQSMVRRPNARELSLSMLTDPVLGPVIKLGAGGQMGSLLPETVAALPPIIAPVAEDLIARSRICQALGTFRGMPPADTEALVRVIMAMSRMAETIPSIAEVVINPLFIDEEGVLAVDCSVAICARSPLPDARHSHMTIAPCALDRKKCFTVPKGPMRMRLIRSDDFEPLRRLLARISRRSAYMRFHKEASKITTEELIDFTQIDYDREVALCVEDDNIYGPEIHAVARFRTLPGTSQAEFGILVEDSCQGNGIGTILMKALEQEARARGLDSLTGYILADNKPMRAMMTKLGYKQSQYSGDSSMLLFTLNLS
ncbi:MAG: bifunctional acetate--CoA ligase family protein/GNAT family N-acetyltransferase [Duodenibacillus sp.]|nr:bifunctional acetate--CoA ligase family protein/GNAT family N-acetyltransferase [Duodenibacillus sp.]